jgi:hypothetical protein
MFTFSKFIEFSTAEFASTVIVVVDKHDGISLYLKRLHKLLSTGIGRGL